jgi:hypothetical protein
VSQFFHELPRSLLGVANCELISPLSALAALGINAPVMASAIVDNVKTRRFVMILLSSGGPMRRFSPSRTAHVISRSADAMTISVRS